MRNANGLKVISGGQTGVDRAALDAAMELGLEVGGFCPKGRKAEDGRMPPKYDFLVEIESANYILRTERNVVESEGTLVLALKRPLAGGAERTRTFTVKHSKPAMVIELEKADNSTARRIQDWLLQANIKILNVAGPRESNCPGIYEIARSFLLKVFDF